HRKIRKARRTVSPVRAGIIRAIDASPTDSRVSYPDSAQVGSADQDIAHAGGTWPRQRSKRRPRGSIPSCSEHPSIGNADVDVISVRHTDRASRGSAGESDPCPRRAVRARHVQCPASDRHRSSVRIGAPHRRIEQVPFARGYWGRNVSPGAEAAARRRAFRTHAEICVEYSLRIVMIHGDVAAIAIGDVIPRGRTDPTFRSVVLRAPDEPARQSHVLSNVLEFGYHQAVVAMYPRVTAIRAAK